jgi:hypothetical protein
LYASLATEKTGFRNANLLVNALALRKTGKEAEGLSFLEEWKVKSSDKLTPEWCLQIYNQHNAQNIPANTDQLRLLARLSDYLSAKN